MENGIGRPKRPEPKEDDLGFDPSQFALDKLDTLVSAFSRGKIAENQYDTRKSIYILETDLHMDFL